MGVKCLVDDCDGDRAPAMMNADTMLRPPVDCFFGHLSLIRKDYQTLPQFTIQSGLLLVGCVGSLRVTDRNRRARNATALLLHLLADASTGCSFSLRASPIKGSRTIFAGQTLSLAFIQRSPTIPSAFHRRVTARAARRRSVVGRREIQVG